MSQFVEESVIITSGIDNVIAFCVCDHTSLTDVWDELQRHLCVRDKSAPPRILVDLQKALFDEHGAELDVFIDHLRFGVWAELIDNGGRLAVVIGTQQNVCVCGRLELLDALAELADATDSVHLAATTEQALCWLGGQHVMGERTGLP